MIDYAIIGLTILSMLVSLWRGFVREVMSLVGWITAFFIASNFYPYLSAFMTQINSDILRNGISVGILFLATLIVSSIINALLGQLVDKTGLSGTDRVLGMAFGGLRGILIVAAILFFLDTFTPSSQSQMWKESHLIPHFDFIIKWFFEQLHANSSFLGKQ